MFKRLAIMVLLLTIIFGGIFGYKVFEKKMVGEYFANFTPPPITVSATKSQAETWQPEIHAIGTLQAVNGVELATEVSGMVQSIHFESGQLIEKGQLLVQIDDEVEQATLKSQQAQLKLAKLNYTRDKQLLTKKAIPQTQFDLSSAELEEAIANMEKTKAIIAQKKIRAPFSGKIGIRLINLGEYINAGASIATLQNIDSLYVDFSLPEQFYPKLYVGQQVRFDIDAYPDKHFIGKVSALNAKVDPNTRNILVRANVDNADHKLIPGMFADLAVLEKASIQVVTVPVTAVTYSLYGDSVFIITEQTNKATDSKPANNSSPNSTTEADKNEAPALVVNRKYIKTGPQQNGNVAVLEGLKAGDQIVTSGQLKLSNGARIVINNDVKI
ncbi:efflux RND transporter periplasmic adaptor subunit [Spartinivicinus poritis]|uniref:Efflux RND transporter periplasmic adaptor subunit n=1 Tax=Spartinivicinus poritis TaxID=2994640 RepID=A0ABT5U715_9GAMM|nr:efflux RND transporter periplasmic adaptor subunit [Spartinivicinus sp. A2-2]MDE1462158.1 efflux RND transporter periplasmic adaptor subunit [Spartinivicinus sp. A2-2]